MGVHQRSTYHAYGFFGPLPERHPTLHKIVARNGNYPAKEIGKPDDTRRVAVAEFNARGVGDLFALECNTLLEQKPPARSLRRGARLGLRVEPTMTR